MFRYSVYYLCACTITGLFAFAALGQNQPSIHNHTTSAQNVIDGEIHPELVPDTAAYRLYLLTIAPVSNPTPEDSARQNSHIRALWLTSTDRQALVIVLADFRARYTELVNQYNESATAALARGEHPDIKTFLQKRKDLVQSVIATLRLSMSLDGMAKLDSHIQAEKRGIKVDVQEAQ